MAGYFGDKIGRRAERVAMQSLLRELRLEQGMTQREVADLLGASQVVISNYETGERRLDVLELRHILIVLDMTIPSFFERLEARLAEIEQSQ